MDRGLSARGKDFAAQKPSFLEVLSDLWVPQSNPNGVVNIGLAENVGIIFLLFICANSSLDSHARGDGEVY